MMKIKKRYLLPVAFLGLIGIAGKTVDSGKYFEIAKNIELFANIYKEINTYYVDDLDPAKTMRVGIDAMLDHLDPYTNYISESEMEGFRYITEGKYNGIGATVQKIGDYPVITEIYENCPAFKAGLKTADVLVSVDGQSAKGKGSDELYDIMKGAPGTEMEISVRRPGESKDLKIKLKRDEVDVPNVPYSGMVSDEIGYVILTTFTRDAGPNIQAAFADLKTKNPNMKGVILDLRGNGGGLLNEAVNLVNVFTPKGEVVVSTRGKVEDWDRSFKTASAPTDEKMPLIVLIDKGSASASEIVSGSLQDLDRGVLMGQRSYGKGLVQNIKDIGYNSKIKLTTSKYYIPSGRCIQGVTYKDGKPVNIPDSLRTAFKTKNGRKVLDGGGVTPDVYIDSETKSTVVKSLVENFYIFDYVTDFSLKNKTISVVKDFHFTQFDEFVKYLETRNYFGETESDKLLNDLREKAKKEKYFDAIAADLKAAENKLTAEKRAEIISHKKDITDLIEKEISSRYYYEKGKIQMGLRNDKEIDEAIKLLKDIPRYQKILSGK
jgi:carboxyl-terminal processing protease